MAGLLLWIGLQTRRHASVSRHGAPWWNADAGPASNTSIGVDVPSNPGLVVGATAGLPEVVERPDDMPPTDSVPLVITERPLPSDAPRASQVFGDTVASVGTALTVEPVPASRLTADELIDLEQQAAFFVALGQDDSAVDLLNAFLRGNGGASPLPYLQLLEIHRRRGEREAHERIRERYERRFGNSLPGWADELVPATSIEDHAEVIEQIESAWADPANAMRLIESMLVDGDRPAASFDLSSFGDLQFLYLLARSLRELDVPAGATVDLLLPLSLTGESLAVVDSTSSRSNAVESPADSICSTASNVDLELDFLPPRADPKPDE
ncbi:MAG: hypothetical protein QFE16_05755 [Pseudomonadota bacterium]|nr:hypothetical protein [Pseudomonadota bacterium]